LLPGGAIYQIIELRAFDSRSVSKFETMIMLGNDSPGRQPGSRRIQRKMLPVLIVCYLRPEKLEILLNQLKSSGRRIYVFIDRADISNHETNTQVFNVAKKFESSLDIEVHWAEKNQGVQLGVPSALNWVFKFENEVIILEDDCLPTKDAYDFFDMQASRLSGGTVMACGTSPWGVTNPSTEADSLSLSSYPLIWGWSTNLESWSKIGRLIQSKTPHLRVLKAIIQNPSRMKILCFFYAAVIRVNRGQLKAWDSPVALEMLLKGYKSVISNKSLIQNSGQDKNASHFLNPDSVLSEIVSQSQAGPASTVLDQSFDISEEVDRKIEKEIYSLKVRHMLAPIKALMGF
jgi:hypothetical protein